MCPLAEISTSLVHTEELSVTSQATHTVESATTSRLCTILQPPHAERNPSFLFSEVSGNLPLELKPPAHFPLSPRADLAQVLKYRGHGFFLIHVGFPMVMVHWLLGELNCYMGTLLIRKSRIITYTINTTLSYRTR